MEHSPKSPLTTKTVQYVCMEMVPKPAVQIQTQNATQKQISLMGRTQRFSCPGLEQTQMEITFFHTPKGYQGFHSIP